MSPGRRKLSKIQLGKQSTFVTPVAATTIWRGAGSFLSDDRQVETIDELAGLIDGADRTAIVDIVGSMELSETPLTPQQFQYLQAMACGGTVTGSTDGSGSDKTYTTNFPTTAGPTPNYYTIEAGDDAEVETMEGVVCTEWTIKGGLRQTARMSAKLGGRQVARLGAGFTGALSRPAVSDLVSGLGKVYYDAIGGAYGTTQVSAQIIAYEVQAKFMWKFLPAMDGTLLASQVAYVGHEITGKLSYYHDTGTGGVGGASGVKADFRTQTPKLLRLDLIGAALGTPGTTYSTEKVIVDLPIKWTKVGVLNEKDGLNTVVGEFRSRYNATAGNAGKTVVVADALSALP